MTATPRSGLLASLWRFHRYGRPHVRALAGGVGLRIAELLADLAQPWPLAVIVDGVLARRHLHGLLAALAQPFAASPIRLLVAATVASLVLAVASAGLDYLGDKLMNGAGERITACIRADLFAHVQRLPLAYHESETIGELTSRLVVDTDRIEDGLVDVFSTLLPGMLNIAGLGAVMLAVNWRLGLLATGAAPLVFAAAWRYTRLVREAARRRRAAEGEMAGYVTETLSGIRTVLAFGRHDHHDARFGVRNARTLAAGLRAVDLRARFTPLLESTAAVGNAALLGLGGWGVLRGWWSLGLLLVMVTYLRNLLKPMRSLSRLSLTLTRAAASAERVEALLAETAVGPTATPAVLPAGDGDHPVAVGFRGVTFDYGRGPVLDGVDLDVGPGERVAILGENGSGKSTLLALSCGLYQPQRGAVALDGVPLASLPLEWLRRHVAVVLQETVLFAGTLRDNIAYARPRASDPEILEAARTARVDAFAADLPAGYDTVLGELGSGLSGGQRQRVGIARALLVDAPVVLLDEPTAGLDIDAEREVLDALGALMEGRTVLMATHRLPLLDLATRVVRLQDGRIAEVRTKAAR